MHVAVDGQQKLEGSPVALQVEYVGSGHVDARRKSSYEGFAVAKPATQSATIALDPAPRGCLILEIIC